MTELENFMENFYRNYRAIALAKFNLEIEWNEESENKEILKLTIKETLGHWFEARLDSAIASTTEGSQIPGVIFMNLKELLRE